MDTIRIIPFDGKVSDNFSFNEYFNPTITHTKLEFDIPKCLIDGIQYLRDYWQEALQITSVFRPNDTFGFHKIGCAVDTVPADSGNVLQRLSDFKEECLNYKKSPLIKGLRAKGVNGFGVEGYCVHLDYRPDENCHLTDELGKFCIFTWENDGSPNGKSTLIY